MIESLKKVSTTAVFFKQFSRQFWLYRSLLDERMLIASIQDVGKPN
jgi:hypothetical protein